MKFIRKKATFLVVILAISCQLSTLSAQVAKGGKKISTDLFGLFFEDINYAADGGLYAELVQNRSFEYNPTEGAGWNPFSFWDFQSPGYSYGRISVETGSPVHSNNPHYITLDARFIGKEPSHKGASGVGIKNTGFNGMVVKAGDNYRFSLFAKNDAATPVDILLQLQDPKGAVLAEKALTLSDKNWKQYTATLVPSASADKASLLVLVTSVGKVSLDMVSLFPEKTFKNRTNGLRSDLAQALADMKPRFIRFPGGCLVHGDGLHNMYRWKNTIGPLEQRVEQRNIWNYHQTAGLGYFEYFQFCEDIGAKALPVVPAGVSCQNSGGTYKTGGTGQRAIPGEEMDDYVQEVLDLIEWANGPVTSTWGAKRAAAGHPEPFNLEYVGVGNEDKITPEFEERFTQVFNAVKKQYPGIKVVGTSGPFHSGEDYEKGWKLANKLHVPIIDEHYYVEPEWFIGNQKRYDSYDRKASKVYLGEYASWGNKLRNALAEAAYLTGLERNGDVVVMASYAPMLAKRNFTQWTTDMIFFDNTSIMLTPNFHVQKLFMNNAGDYYYGGVIAKNEKDTTLAASCVLDSQTGDIIVKLVNVSAAAKTMKVNLSRFGKLNAKAVRTLLTGDAQAENTQASPDKVAPVVSSFNASNKFDYTAPPMSLTVIRFKRNK